MATRDDGSYQAIARCLEQLRQAATLEEAPLREVCGLLDRLPDVRQRIISEANSASEGIWRRIDDVHHATARLGLKRLEQILDKFVSPPTRVPRSPHFGKRAAS